MLKPIYENIPDDLKKYRQWVNWKTVSRDGKLTKPPFMPSGKAASSTDPGTWSHYLTVQGACRAQDGQFDGLGFVLTKDDAFIALDFDHCRCPAFDGVTPWANSLDTVLPEIADRVKRLNSYTERSPSGKGLRVFLKGNLPVDGKRKGSIEAYRSGRYVTVTGHVLDGCPRTIEPRQTEIDEFYGELFGEAGRLAEHKKQAGHAPAALDCRSALDRAFASKHGEEIRRLWEGDYSPYPSQSEADLALCSHLAFWLNGDVPTIDAAFRASGLYREKWDRKHHSDGKTYGQGTIDAVLKNGAAPSEGVPPEELNDREDNNGLSKEIQELAALSPLEYDRKRKEVAKKLGVREATLDQEVAKARQCDTDKDFPFAETEPWPEIVDSASLLSEVATTIRRFIVCEEEVSHAAALWVAMTWFIDVVQIAPLAVITAPEKRCGKSLLLSILYKLSARAIIASNISPAALFRTINKWHPTLLIDEADSFLKDNEELRGILNSGHTRDSAYVIRTEGESFTPIRFNTWGAKALAGIGHIADTLMDRAIILELRRKLPHEKTERIRDNEKIEPELFSQLRSKLARFAADHAERVRQAQPPLPGSLNDRAQDNWEPLLAIATVAGHDWLEIGTTAALRLSGKECVQATIGTELLSDIWGIFQKKEIDRISTTVLIDALCSDEEKRWATYFRGQNITPRQLAARLKEYGILSKTIRIANETAKGYERDQFAETFSRYVAPLSPEISVTTSQPAPAKDLPIFPRVTHGGNVTDRNEWKPAPIKDCDVVTDKNREPDSMKNLWEVII